MKTLVPPADRLLVATAALAQRAAAGPSRDRGHALAVISVVGFVMYVGLALNGGGGRALTLTYPAGCLLVGLVCYLRSPSWYVGFTWWTWLLTPFVRRVFDLKYGFHPASPLLLGPLLVSSLAIFTLVRYRRALASTTYAPFYAALVALLYAYLVGLFRQSPAGATYDLVLWGVPIIFGMHLALEWRRFPRLKLTTSAVAVWGMLITGVYGIWQFVNPPIWDRAWVVSAELFSVGIPAPYLIRVFSTLNAPGPFAMLMVCAFLYALVSPQRWRYIALAAGLVALLLTKGRSAWGALLVGAVLLQIRQPLRSVPRQWVALALVLLMAWPVIMQPRVLRIVSARAATLSELSSDNSYRSRVGTTQGVSRQLLSNPVGSGLGAFGGANKLQSGARGGIALDSGPLEAVGTMGWIGGTLYFMSLLFIVLRAVRRDGPRLDAMADAAAAVVFAMVAASFFGNVFTGFSGFLLWGGVGLLIAGRSHGIASELAARYANHPGLPRRPAVVTHPSAA